VIGVPSILIVIRETVSLVRVLPTSTFRVDENDTRWKWNSPRLVYSLMISLCNLPDVVGISGIKETVLVGLLL
jgi:hypothetical protein